MRNIARGQLDQMRILFDRHHVHLYNFLYQMSGDKMLSQDLTQDTFYKIMKYRSSYNNGRFVAWLFTIARNSLKTYFRNTKSNDRPLEDVDYMLVAEEEKNEDYSHLHRALARLENADREILILSKLREIKNQDLAEIMGSSPGAVKTRVSRALRKLRGVYFENI